MFKRLKTTGLGHITSCSVMNGALERICRHGAQLNQGTVQAFVWRIIGQPQKPAG
jgi:hypothetical protein